MRFRHLCYSFGIVAVTFLNSSLANAQKNAMIHEIAPFMGLYAPDRFQTSLAFGMRYYYNLDSRFGVGLVLGFANAKQDYLRKIRNFVIDPGSDRVVFHGARVTHSFPVGKVEPYLLFHLGLTRLHDENNLTFALGLGTRIYTARKFSFRYEFMDYIFTSGNESNAWTNNNVEVSFILGYFL